MTDEEAKRQFIIFAILRIGGVVLFLLGIAIAFTDLLRPGGWKLLGGILVIVGTIEAVISPRLVKRSMARTDER
jgi:membrane protein implicated in regulation of membrane protease activity